MKTRNQKIAFWLVIIFLLYIGSQSQSTTDDDLLLSQTNGSSPSIEKQTTQIPSEDLPTNTLINTPLSHFVMRSPEPPIDWL